MTVIDGNIPHTVEALPHQSKQAELLWVGSAQLFDGAAVQDKDRDNGRFLRGSEFSRVYKVFA